MGDQLDLSSQPAEPAVPPLTGPSTDSEKPCSVHNETFRRLRLSTVDDQAYILPPLGKVDIPEDELESIRDLTAWKHVGAVRVSEPQVPSSPADWLLGLVFWVVVIGFFVGVWSAPSVVPGVNPVVAGAVSVAGLGVLGLIAYFAVRAGKFRFLNLLKESLTLILTLAIGAALPVLIVNYFGDGVQLRSDGPSLELLGRILQLTLIVTASLLPAMLYFLFDRQRLRTLRARFYRDIFRLDPGVRTLRDVRNKYDNEIEEVYGPDEEGNQGRRMAGTRWPIAVATTVITWGWVVALLPVGEDLVVSQPTDLLLLLRPPADPIVFGFLGAYFFALNLIVRRYVRGDLRPKAYGTITVRIFLVVLLAWVFERFIDHTNTVLAFAFFAGIVPDTMLVRLQELVRFNVLTAEKHPLTDLEGIDLYDRARLMDEGVTNIESLAHHDLIDLLLQTRIPAPRLIDWVDQAILYLHVDTTVSTDDSKTPSMYEQLRGYGVRTASDLEDIVCSPDASPDADDCIVTLPGSEQHPSRLRVILRTLDDEEWMAYIRHWRDSAFIEEQIVTWPGEVYGEAQPAPQPRSTMSKHLIWEQEHAVHPVQQSVIPTGVADGNGFQTPTSE